MGSMRAVVCDRLGDPSVLKVQDMPIPEAGPRDVVVRVGAGGVNFPDILSVSGNYQHKQHCLRAGHGRRGTSMPSATR